MGEIRELLKFTGDHFNIVAITASMLVIIGFCLSRLLSHIVPKTVHLLGKCPIIGRYLTCIPRFLCSYGVSWAYYRLRRDAVILNTISDCRSFLSLHFTEGKSGEVWLFRTDLRVFWNNNAFTEMYEDIVDKVDGIRKVRILVPRGYFNETDAEKHYCISANHWSKIYTNLVKLKRNDKIVFDEYDADSLSDDFIKYVSDESFVFYTKGESLNGKETICIHRRYDDRNEDGKDLRITLVASRDGDSSRSDPLFQRFLRHDYIGTFESLFTARAESSWKTLISEAEKRK